ncbi:MAG: putative toxin-antitoxin system toxin component, PIN family [Verrucomicrobiales bacterium]|nr:putative toxin-antitoxin system toxin component, PIN family [Verrucomicrobiales bacterium]
MVVVLDTTSFVSGIFWRTEAHQVLQAFANGRIVLAVTQSILREYARVTLAVCEEEGLPVDPQPWLTAVGEMAFEFEPVPPRERVCRDANDDQFIVCALAAHADAIVTRDNDLLALGKPFGIPILTPWQLLSRMTLRQRELQPRLRVATAGW